MKKNIILIGGGGHCLSCIDTIEQLGIYAIEGIIDLPERVGQKILDYKIIGTDTDLLDLIKEDYVFLISLGQIKSGKRRRQLFSILIDAGATMPTIISPMAYVSPHAQVGTGTIIMHGAIVNANTTVGRNCIINSMSLIEHDTSIGDNSHIATGAIINGNTHIGSDSFIGSQAMIREGLTIGAQVLIGAGCRIFKNVSDASIIKA